MIGSIEDWTGLYREALRCLKPGGWLEHTDFDARIRCDDGSVPEGSIYEAWNSFYVEAGGKIRKTFSVTENGQNAGWMRDAGFTGELHIKDFKLPLGTWAAEKKWKEIGAFNLLGCDYGLDGYPLYLGTEVLGWSLQEIQDLVAGVRMAMRNRSWHAYYPW